MLASELVGVDEKVLREALRLKKQKVREAEAETQLPPLPPYVQPDDPADKLAFEFGLELAFRPKGDPDKIDAATLAPLVHLPMSKIKTGNGGIFFRPNMLQKAFHAVFEGWAKQMKAETHNTKMSSCSSSEIEFPSPIMTRISQVSWYYDRVRNIADGIGAKVDSEKRNSGGGHMHVTKLKGDWTDAEKFSVVMAMIEEPWIGWVFNDPDDRSTAISPVKAFINAMWNWDDDCATWWDAFDLDGSHTSVRWNTGAKPTIEFRCFQAPQNREEQLLHVKFVDRWLTDVLTNRKQKLNKKTPPTLPYLFPQELVQIKFGEANAKFNARLTQIGLNPLDYLPLVERNMKKRYDNGWVRN